MKKNWEEKKLGEVCNISTGKWDANHAVTNGEYRFFTCARESMLCNTKRFSGECLILPGNGVNVGDVYYYKGDFDAYQRTYVISNIKLYPKFLFYHMVAYWKERNLNKQYGSATNFLKIGNFNEYEVSLPPLPEQKRIVAILDEAFTAIATAKENAEKNLKNARELFESYLQSVFTNSSSASSFVKTTEDKKATEDRPGDGWEVKKLGEVCELTRGHNPPKSKFINEPKEGYVRFYQIRDGWADDYAVYVPDTPQLHKVTPDDILMVAYRHIGKVFRGVSGAFNVALCKISNIRKDILDDDFLFYMIPTDIIKGELMKRSERSLIPSMSVEHLKEIAIPLPPLSEQQVIVQKHDAFTNETKKLEAIYKQKLTDLDELKKSLLHQAFNGQL